MAAVWPASLPQRFQATPGVTETPPDIVIESPMDVGPPKARRRYTAGFRLVGGTLALTHAQRATLDTFFLDTLQGGALPFDWIHPITSAPATFRFMPQPNGLKYMQAQPDVVDHITAELQLRIMP